MRVDDFTDSSLHILVYVVHEVPDWSTELRERERPLIDMVRLVDHLGVQFAFPTRTVHLYAEEHAPPTVRHPVPEGLHEQDARSAGMVSARAITRQARCASTWQAPRTAIGDGRRRVTSAADGSSRPEG